MKRRFLGSKALKLNVKPECQESFWRVLSDEIDRKADSFFSYYGGKKRSLELFIDSYKIYLRFRVQAQKQDIEVYAAKPTRNADIIYRSLVSNSVFEKEAKILEELTYFAHKNGF